MSVIGITLIEQRRDGKLVYSVRSQYEGGRIEFPIAIQDTGTKVQNEAAVLLSTHQFAEELIDAIRPRVENRKL